MKEILIQLRTEHRYSQNALAKELGISRQAYIKYETDEVEPSVEIIRKLSKIYNVSYAYLIDNGFLDTQQNEYSFNNKTNELFVASPSPYYGSAAAGTVSKTIQDIQKELSKCSYEQITAISNLIQSISSQNQNPNLTKTKRAPGGLKCEFWMSDDFDAPLDEFKEYM